MGEYIQCGKDEIKIGTCEDLYYVRYATLARLAQLNSVRQAPGNCTPKEYLTAGNDAFRFRFPWPDEDGERFYNGIDSDRTLTLDINMSVIGECNCNKPHDQFSLRMQKPLDGQLWAVIVLPCGYMCRIDANDAWKIGDYVLNRTTDKFTRLCMHRMQAGYVNPLLV